MIIVDKIKLGQTIAQLRRSGKKIVFTNGCFDLLHKGHIDYLKTAKSMGDILIVGINSDESIKMFKGNNRPIMPLESRMAVLDSVKYVDYTVPFSERLPNELIKVVRPDIHVKGGDYTPEELPETELVKSLGGIVKVVKFIPGYSVTTILNKIRNLSSV